jgi:membrane protein YqaA with SNARE-associated domain
VPRASATGHPPVVGIYLASFAIAIVSGVFPLVNGEAYLIGIVLAAGADVPHAIVLAILVACGQMIASSVLFHAARGVTWRVGSAELTHAPVPSFGLGGRRRQKLEDRIMRARIAVAKWGNKRFALLCTSASLGLPPFLLTSLAAGALEIRFRSFLAIGLAGRIVRFTAVGVGAALV